MTDKLLPCPFCGCDCIDEYEGDFGNGVYCMQCGVMMGEPIHLEFRSPRVSFEQAIAAWNTRTERTCTNVGYYIDGTRFKCSECGYNGWTKWAKDGEDKLPSYCPNCGAKVIS